MKHVSLITALVLTLASCSTPEPESGPTDMTDPCGAKAYSGLLGAPLAAVTLPADLTTRVLRPGEMATLDFLPERLNIALDEDDVIVGLSCG